MKHSLLGHARGSFRPTHTKACCNGIPVLCFLRWRTCIAFVQQRQDNAANWLGSFSNMHWKSKVHWSRESSKSWCEKALRESGVVCIIVELAPGGHTQIALGVLTYVVGAWQRRGLTRGGIVRPLRWLWVLVLGDATSGLQHSNLSTKQKVVQKLKHVFVPSGSRTGHRKRATGASAWVMSTQFVISFSQSLCWSMQHVTRRHWLKAISNGTSTSLLSDCLMFYKREREREEERKNAERTQHRRREAEEKRLLTLTWTTTSLLSDFNLRMVLEFCCSWELKRMFDKREGEREREREKDDTEYRREEDRTQKEQMLRQKSKEVEVWGTQLERKMAWSEETENGEGYGRKPLRNKHWFLPELNNGAKAKGKFPVRQKERQTLCK